jgi:hypothetical protein
MAYDAGLAERIRECLARLDGVEERRMFGGLAFLRHGHLVVGILGASLMARVGPAAYRVSLARPHVREMDFTGRPMTGYVTVDPDGIAEDHDLRAWIDACVAHVGTLPRKPAK